DRLISSILTASGAGSLATRPALAAVLTALLHLVAHTDRASHAAVELASDRRQHPDPRFYRVRDRPLAGHCQRCWLDVVQRWEVIPKLDLRSGRTRSKCAVAARWLWCGGRDGKMWAVIW